MVKPHIELSSVVLIAVTKGRRSSHGATPRATPGFRRTWQHRSLVLVYAIVDLRSSSDHPLGDAVETFVRRDAERFLDEPELAEYLRIEERQLEAGGLN